MTKKQIIERDENGQPIIDVAQEEIKAEIQVSINKLLKKREEAKVKYGQLKRTTFEAIEDRGLMNPESLFEENQKIEAKESKLSSAERQFVQQIVLLSMQVVFERKTKEAQEAATELDKPALPKKKRAKKTTKAKK